MHSRSLGLNWSEKVGQLLFGGHRGRILRILILFLCALGVLVGIYRARGARIEKLNSKPGPKTIISSNHLTSSSSSTTKWVIVGNPDNGNSSSESSINQSSSYICSLAKVAKESGWKTIVIGNKIQCCRLPECYPIHASQFLRMSYKSATVLKSLTESAPTDEAYKESIRNLAYIWVIHRGARFIFDAYLQEYLQINTDLDVFEAEMSRQLQTLALDDSLALVEDRALNVRRQQQQPNLFRNPYSHFGRPDISLIPNQKPSAIAFPNFRICEVRPPSIEKFLEIDSGWWDRSAPALVLPGDTMPPLCTRNTLFSPDVFWALPLLPDYSNDPRDEEQNNKQSSRIPPWYIRGLWSQSLLGDLGGSIRLSLNRIPTLTEPESRNGTKTYSLLSEETHKSSKLLKRWHCRSRSTYRCLSLISKELSKSINLSPQDLNIIEAWIVDLKSIHYSEPPMLPRRRSHSNPCLGADGLHGVSFFPQIKPQRDQDEIDRNDTLYQLGQKYGDHSVKKRDAGEIGGGKPELIILQKSDDKNDAGQRPPAGQLLPPLQNSTYYMTNWTAFNSTESSPEVGQRSLSSDNSYFPDYKPEESKNQSSFNLLKTISDNLCPGYSKLIPNFRNEPKTPLLIINFKNHHYDLLPTFEVLYRSTYPNILYCGHPHVSIDLFMKKYQSVEHRSLNFLPTYTKASYECLLGAMEINFDVSGYLVLTDEAIVKSWTVDFDETILVGESKRDVVDEDSWRRLDSKGMKLPKLIDGVINSFKLFSFILQGGNSHTVHKRSLDEGQADSNTSSAKVTQFQTNQTDRGFENGDLQSYLVELKQEKLAAAKTNESKESLLTSDWETSSDDIDVGDEFEEIDNSTTVIVTSLPPLEEVRSEDLDLDLLMTTPPPVVLESENDTESAVLPLYHVEHGGNEQPTPPTWHKPDDVSSTPGYVELTVDESKSVSTSQPAISIVAVEDEEENVELRREMSLLLDSLNDVFRHMIQVGVDSEFVEDPSHVLDHPLHPHSHRISPREFRHIRCSSQSEITEGHSAGAHPHGGAPPHNHPHYSDPLCSTLRSFILNLYQNPLSSYYNLTHSSTPIYYIPSSLSKPFYSVANVLLHFNVLDELALPILFQGLAEGDLKILRRGDLGDKGAQFVAPFNHHKIYQDSEKQARFCSHFLRHVL